MYNVRAVRFIKTTAETPILDNQNARYICLGHFDMMEIDELGDSLSDKPLKSIQNDRISGRESEFGYSENYVYSLYMLCEADTPVSSSIQTFWTQESVFTVVTRIHCDLDESVRAKAFTQVLKDHCLSGAKNVQLVELDQGKKQNGTVIFLKAAVAGIDTPKESVHCIFYDSLELGDTVAVMKSASLSACLEVVRFLSSNPCVRDTYTYCGILAKVIRSNEPIEGLTPRADALLPTVTTRFSIRDNCKADNFFNLLRYTLNIPNNQFYVTGTADHSIRWNECTEERLLEIMRYITQNSAELHNCFNDVITRVGLDYVPPLKQGSATIYRRNISEKIPRYNETMQYLRSKIGEDANPNWQYSLCKLLGTLDTMYNNYVMDDLANLILPSVNALLERLFDLRDEIEGNPELVDDVTQFIKCWTELNNDITQLESQLTQHPEIHPVRYYIPAILMQFELMILEKCSIALSDEGERKFHPMLVTTNSPNVFTICPLDPRNDDSARQCPLLVFIPVVDLYRPWEVVCRATHEMAHYCVDTARSRNERHAALVQCIAYYTVDRWYNRYIKDILDDSDGMLYQKSKEYVEKLSTTIYQLACDKLSVEDLNDIHLAHSRHAITQTIYTIQADERYLEQYLFFACPDYFYSNRYRYPRILASNNRGLDYLIYTRESESFLNTLTHFCAECYADIAMILLLQSNFLDYYRCVYHDEYILLKKDYNGIDEHPLAPSVVKHIERMALVISTMQKTLGDQDCSWSWAQISVLSRKEYPWIGFACDFVDQISKPSTLLQNNPFSTCDSGWHPELLNVETFNVIVNYLVGCTEKLKQKMMSGNNTTERAKSIKEIRKYINYVSTEHFNWSQIQSFLLNTTEPTT